MINCEIVGQAYVSTFDGRMLIRTSCTRANEAPMHASFLIHYYRGKEAMEIHTAEEPFVTNNKRLRGKYFKIFEHVECAVEPSFKAWTAKEIIDGIEAMHDQHGYTGTIVPGCEKKIIAAINFFVQNEQQFEKMLGKKIGEVN